MLSDVVFVLIMNTSVFVPSTEKRVIWKNNL